MIDAIDLRGLRNAEYLQFIGDFITIVDENDPTALNVLGQLDPLKDKQDDLKDLFKLDQKNEITEELVSIDLQRDNAITGISFIINGFMYHTNPVIKKAAIDLNENLNVYGSGIARQNLMAETATITSIVGDWEDKPVLAAALTALNLVAWKNELKAANILFNQRYLARTQEYATANPENLKMKRDATNQAYYELRKFLDAYSVTLGTPAYVTTINQLNALIAQYNTLLNNRLAGAAVPPVVPPVV